MAAGRTVGRKLFYTAAAVVLSVKAQGVSVSAIAGYPIHMPPPFGLGHGGVSQVSAINIAQPQREGPRTTAAKPSPVGHKAFEACGTNCKGQSIDDPNLKWCNHDAIGKQDANAMEMMRTSTVHKQEEIGEEKEGGMYPCVESNNCSCTW